MLVGTACRVLVETGTFYGDMVEAMSPYFDQIYSVELNRDLHLKAAARLASRKNVELIQGDSGVELEELVGRIDRPTLFWLDGHYSGGVTARGETDTPILRELSHILDAPLLGTSSSSTMRGALEPSPSTRPWTKSPSLSA